MTIEIMSSGALNPIDVKKHIAPKSLFFTRPGLTHYTAEKNEEGTDMRFYEELGDTLKGWKHRQL